MLASNQIFNILKCIVKFVSVAFLFAMILIKSPGHASDFLLCQDKTLESQNHILEEVEKFYFPCFFTEVSLDQLHCDDSLICLEDELNTRPQSRLHLRSNDSHFNKILKQAFTFYLFTQYLHRHFQVSHDSLLKVTYLHTFPYLQQASRALTHLPTVILTV